ncbi:hypothetical protein BC629DRAFT_1534954 [Irpex lacteus]|nr:hypothetical protein BC629DRAFT_1534954 [Irpex lacteus]
MGWRTALYHLWVYHDESRGEWGHLALPMRRATTKEIDVAKPLEQTIRELEKHIPGQADSDSHRKQQMKPGRGHASGHKTPKAPLDIIDTTLVHLENRYVLQYPNSSDSIPSADMRLANVLCGISCRHGKAEPSNSNVSTDNRPPLPVFLIRPDGKHRRRRGVKRVLKDGIGALFDFTQE